MKLISISPPTWRYYSSLPKLYHLLQLFTTHQENEGVTALQVANQIKEKILVFKHLHYQRLSGKAATQLTCSIGIATNRMLAKICTGMQTKSILEASISNAPISCRVFTLWLDINKPNGVFSLPADREKIMEFMRPLHVILYCKF